MNCKRGCHLGESELQAEQSSCPLCGNGGVRKPIQRLQNGPDVDLLECFACRGISASRLPKSETLSHYYSRYTYLYPGQKSDHVTFSNPERFSRHLAQYIHVRPARMQKGLIRMLDFGGGDGSLSVYVARHLVRKYGHMRFRIDVVDPNACAFQEDAIQVCPFSRLEGTGADYDIVIASSVLDHLIDPIAVIDALFQKLGSGGFFYTRVSYVTPFFLVYPTLNFKFPEHIHELGPLFWRTLLRREKYRHLKMRSFQTSIIETTFRYAPFRTLAAYICKFPSWIENRIVPTQYRPVWPFVGGWECILEKKERI